MTSGSVVLSSDGLILTCVGDFVRLMMKGSISSETKLKFGVPQGLLLGPKFSLYILMSLGRLFLSTLCSITSILMMFSFF